MASVVVTIKLMPESPKTDMAALQKSAEKTITAFGGRPAKADVEPIAFGLKALNLYFIMDEKQGSTEPLEEKLSKLKGVQSVNVTDVRRAIG